MKGREQTDADRGDALRICINSAFSFQAHILRTGFSAELKLGVNDRERGREEKEEDIGGKPAFQAD